jgi:hypothetical protein
MPASSLHFTGAAILPPIIVRTVNLQLNVGSDSQWGREGLVFLTCTTIFSSSEVKEREKFEKSAVYRTDLQTETFRREGQIFTPRASGLNLKSVKQKPLTMSC